MPSRFRHLVRASDRFSRRAGRADDWKLSDNLGGTLVPLAERGGTERTRLRSPGKTWLRGLAGADMGLCRTRSMAIRPDSGRNRAAAVADRPGADVSLGVSSDLDGFQEGRRRLP